MNGVAMEHRWGLRRSVEVNVIIQTRTGVVGKGTLSDVSASGGRVASSLPVRVQSTVLVELKIRTARATLRSFVVEAEIIRHTETGFALEWVQFAPKGVRALLSPQPEYVRLILKERDVG